MIRKNLPLFLTFLLALSLDIGSKLRANQILVEFKPISLMGEWLRITLNYNTGVAFGLFANGGSWPLVVTSIIIASLAVWLVRAIHTGELPSVSGWAVGMILGGAVGNFADRLPDGKVTDFIDVGIGTNRWPTSNFADIFITLGVIFLLWSTFFTKSKKEVKS